MSKHKISILKELIVSILVFSTVMALSACNNSRVNLSDEEVSANIEKNQAEKEIISMHASWANYYYNVEELVENSDFIGLVEITGIHSVTSKEQEGIPGALTSTDFEAKVIDPVMGDQEVIYIHMTGSEGETYITQITDDPLLKVGEKWFIFARANENGTHTMLGPIGRYIYNESGTVSSMNNMTPSVEMHTPEALDFDALPLADLKAEIAKYMK